eukprot:4931638-Amphidinium_carterae.1
MSASDMSTVLTNHYLAPTHAVPPRLCMFGEALWATVVLRLENCSNDFTIHQSRARDATAYPPSPEISEKN